MKVKNKFFTFALVTVLLFIGLFQLAHATDNVGEFWFYDRLDSEAGHMYQKFQQVTPASSTIKFDFQETVTEQNNIESILSRVFKALPEAFYTHDLDGKSFYSIQEFSSALSYMNIGGKDNFSLTVGCKIDPFFSNDFEGLQARYEEELSSVPVYGSIRYEKLKSIYDYLCDTVEYLDSDIAGTPYAALVEKKAVCEGYARAFKALCDREGIPCLLAFGLAGQGEDKEDHMWNYVQMENGKWYALDATWGDQVYYIDYDYFLIGKDTNIKGWPFSQTHIQETEILVEDVSPQIKAFPVKLQYPDLSTVKFSLEDDFDENTDDIPPADKTLISILVAQDPLKTKYFEGEKFNPQGMVVVAKYDDGSSKVITNYTSKNPKLVLGQKSVTISYDGKETSVEVLVTKIKQEVILEFKPSFEIQELSQEDDMVWGFLLDVAKKVSDFLENLTGNQEVLIKNKDGEILAKDRPIGSGSIVELVKGGEVLGFYTLVVKGDTNGDGKITSSDARLALRFSAKIEQGEEAWFLPACDVDGNKKVTAADARKILRVSARLDAF